MRELLVIALTVDSGYAMPAAVTIRSAIESTPGNIVIYIVDCGLSGVERDRLQQSIPAERTDVMMTFPTLPPGSVASSLGVTYARVDLCSILEVEKVLYLDADILVRGDLRAIWRVDMAGQPLAAISDFATPFGHVAVGKGTPYFNAGVLLMDLRRIRDLFAKEPIMPLAEKMRHHRSKDQDLLNVYFRGNWLKLPLKWNAQGLGTAVEMHNPGHGEDEVREMKEDPQIVHYIGAVHPPMELIIYDWYPFASKPWGYAGAPNHPFEGDWWDMLEKTAWKGIRENKEYQGMLERKKAAAVERGIAEFHRKLAVNEAWCETRLLVPGS